MLKSLLSKLCEIGGCADPGCYPDDPFLFTIVLCAYIMARACPTLSVAIVLRVLLLLTLQGLPVLLVVIVCGQLLVGPHLRAFRVQKGFRRALLT